VNAGKSKYYGAAFSNFERARRCYDQAGLLADWNRVVSTVRSQHHRKTGFMSGFEDVVAGSARARSRRSSIARRRGGALEFGGRRMTESKGIARARQSSFCTPHRWRMKVRVLFKDETAWLTQRGLAELFGVQSPQSTST